MSASGSGRARAAHRWCWVPKTCQPGANRALHFVLYMHTVSKHCELPLGWSMQPGPEPSTEQFMAPKPKGQGLPVLYLDLDGVLHHESVWWHPRRGAYLQAPERYSLFQHAQLLDELLAPYPDLLVVLSTNWQRRYPFSKVLKRLTPALRARVVGGTYRSDMRGDGYDLLPRWAQIVNDVQRRRPAAWLALDDDFIGWPKELLGHLVVTDPYEGISPRDVQDAIRLKLADLVKAALRERLMQQDADDGSSRADGDDGR
jgi:hypothetical protein